MRGSALCKITKWVAEIRRLGCYLSSLSCIYRIKKNQSQVPSWGLLQISFKTAQETDWSRCSAELTKKQQILLSRSCVFGGGWGHTGESKRLYPSLSSRVSGIIYYIYQLQLRDTKRQLCSVEMKRFFIRVALKAGWKSWKSQFRGGQSTDLDL